MKRYNIITFLLNASTNGYIQRVQFDKVTENDIILKVIVKNKHDIVPILNMIEANLYIKRELYAKSVNRVENKLFIQTFNGVLYTINVKSKGKQ